MSAPSAALVNGQPNPNDPFLVDFSADCLFAIPVRPDLSVGRELTPELREWLIRTTPGVMVDHRSTQGLQYLVFAFKDPNHTLLFKLRWWNP
jgi:hypothetical protein